MYYVYLTKAALTQRHQQRETPSICASLSLFAFISLWGFLHAAMHAAAHAKGSKKSVVK